jgi:hypothetical protein
MKLTTLVVTAALAAAPSLLAGPVQYFADLNGPNESPANASPGTGRAKVIIDVDAHTLDVTVTFGGLVAGVTASHIHAATAIAGTGTAGVFTQTPTFTGFPSGVTSGSYHHIFDTTLSSTYRAATLAGFGGSTSAAEAALAQAMEDGKAYLNIHTNVFPGGEIRGFLQPVPEPGTFLLAGLALAGAMLRRKRAQA